MVPGGDPDTLVCHEGILALLAAASLVEVLAWCASEAGHRPKIIVGAACVLTQTASTAAIEVLAWNAEEADETHMVIAQRLNSLHAGNGKQKSGDVTRIQWNSYKLY